ncbi:[acyl-carrier-protein] S-malonyltransferase [Aureococcus anophagefferens]|nr:[acyl-carrier-protein] S-malonyltransferase [Aureococcus anophagefferens]
MCKPTEARDQLSKPLLRYRCIAKKSATLRAGRELSSAKRELEILHGWTVDVADVAENGAGVLRCRVVSYSTPWTPPGASPQAADGWVSAKLFAYDGQSAHPNPDRAEVEEEVEEKKPAKEKKGFAAVFDAPTGAGAPTGEGHALLFPGQGAQKVGMLEPYKSAPGVKAMFKKASKIFGTDLLELVEKGPAEKLNDTRYSQVCVFLTSMAAVKSSRGRPRRRRALQRHGGLLAGRVLGADVRGRHGARPLALLKLRGEAMGAACDLAPSGMMTVIGLEDEALAEVMPDDVTIANQMFPKGRVLSGSKDGIAKVEAAVKALNVAGVKTIVQPVLDAPAPPPVRAFFVAASSALRSLLAPVISAGGGAADADGSSRRAAGRGQLVAISNAVSVSSARLRARDAKHSNSQVSGAFHSPYMASAADKLEAALASAAFARRAAVATQTSTAGPAADAESIKRKMKERWPASSGRTMNHMPPVLARLSPRWPPAVVRRRLIPIRR